MRARDISFCELSGHCCDQTVSTSCLPQPPHGGFSVLARDLFLVHNEVMSTNKLFLGLCAGLAFTLFPIAVFAETIYPLSFSHTGKHNGEVAPIEYTIEYHGSLGVTTASASGITYAPYGFWPTFEPTILPERYFRDYPLYFSGGTMAFTVHLKNTSDRTYRNLLVITAQEFLNTEGGVGVLFPGDAAHNWKVDRLGPGEELLLSGSLILPYFGSSGIDQTHLQILHFKEGNDPLEHIGAGRVILDAPQAGLWCPLIP